MSEDTRFDVALDAITELPYKLDPEVADAIARNVVAALRAFESTHSSDRSLGVRRWDVMAHESRVRQQIERAVRALPTVYYTGPTQDRETVNRDEVLLIVKGPISG